MYSKVLLLLLLLGDDEALPLLEKEDRRSSAVVAGMVRGWFIGNNERRSCLGTADLERQQPRLRIDDETIVLSLVLLEKYISPNYVLRVNSSLRWTHSFD